MKHHVWLWTLIIFATFSIAKGAVAQSEIPRATLTCVQLSPSVEAGKLTRDTVIESILKYSIDLKKIKRNRFSITILFGSTEGQSHLFNKKETRLGDADLYLEKSSGTVTLKYPMDAVWQDNRLKRPVSIIFYIVEHEKNGDSRAIASAGPFIFRSLF